MKKYLLIFVCLISIKSFAFDTWWHAECTRKAMVANGFSNDARLATQVSNYLTDFLAVVNMGNDKLDEFKIKSLRFRSDASYDNMHFDAIYTTADIQKNWDRIYNNTKAALIKFSDSAKVEKGFRNIVLFNIIGASLHIVQDFYSHSNWVNTFAGYKIFPIPTWFEKDSAYKASLSFYTGVYPDGAAKGKVNHKELNKDCSTQELNTLAVQAAERASIEWIKKLMEDVPEIDWASLKNYNVQNNMIMKNFLVKLDASFLTTSSIVADKFDGEKSVKHVFSADTTKEKVQAAATLVLTINEYDKYLLANNNKYRIPSPYWSGFMVYNITRYLADGLKLNGKYYVNKK